MILLLPLDYPYRTGVTLGVTVCRPIKAMGHPLPPRVTTRFAALRFAVAEAAAPEADVTSCEVVTEKGVENVFGFNVVRIDSGNSACTWRKAKEGEGAIYWELAIGVSPSRMHSGWNPLEE